MVSSSTTIEGVNVMASNCIIVSIHSNPMRQRMAAMITSNNSDMPAAGISQPKLDQHSRPRPLSETETLNTFRDSRDCRCRFSLEPKIPRCVCSTQIRPHTHKHTNTQAHRHTTAMHFNMRTLNRKHTHAHTQNHGHMTTVFQR